MKVKGSRMFKKRDFILIALLALAAGGAFFCLPMFRSAPPPEGTLYLRFAINGENPKVLPLIKEETLTIDQSDGKVNVLQLTPEGFFMASSSCHNQLCVSQGRVTAENMNTRPLFHMVVCAPHRLVAELLTEPPEDGAPYEE